MLTPQAASAALTRTGAFVLLFDEYLALRYWNRTVARSVEIPWDQAEGRRPAEVLFAGEDGARFEAALRQVRDAPADREDRPEGGPGDTRAEPRLETSWRAPDAATPPRRLAWSVSLLRGAAPEGHLVAVGLDVTERHRAEQALRRSEARYRAVMWQITDVVCLLEGDTGVIVEANQAMHQLLGYAEGELLGKRIHELVAHAPETVDENLRHILRDGRRWLGERAYLRRDGGRVPAEVQVDALELPGERLLCVVGRDLRPRREQEARLRRQEEALRRAQRLESVGQLAAGVAHDFNNLLTTMIGFSELIRDSFDPDDPRLQDVEAVIEAGERGSALVRQLLAFSRQQHLQPTRLDLNEAVRDALGLLRPLIGEDIHVQTRLTPDLPAVQADPNQVSQVLLNLAVNARDAMPRGGELRIETHAARWDAEALADQPGASPGSFVCLRVTDNGSGMSPEVQARAFEPFFTTKPELNGTGMGLATVVGIVEQHHGFVSLDSRPGEGTCFEIHLPALDVIERSEAPPVRPPAPRARPQAAVLVVEDEPTVLSYACRTLESAGYEVIRAADAEDALARVKERARLPDALFSDVVLPHMSGLELAASLRQQDPTLPVLLTTGHLGTLERQQEIAEQGWAFLSKPYGIDALVYEIGRLLDERNPA